VYGFYRSFTQYGYQIVVELEDCRISLPKKFVFKVEG